MTVFTKNNIYLKLIMIVLYMYTHYLKTKMYVTDSRCPRSKKSAYIRLEIDSNLKFYVQI